MKETTWWTIQASLVYRQIYNPWETKAIWKSVGFYLSGSVIVFSIPENICLSTTKQNNQVLNIFEYFRYNKTVIAFIWGEHQVVNPREVVLLCLKPYNHPWADNFRCTPHKKAIIIYWKINGWLCPQSSSLAKSYYLVSSSLYLWQC